jgi:hypothetical protein
MVPIIHREPSLANLHDIGRGRGESKRVGDTTPPAAYFAIVHRQVTRNVLIYVYKYIYV